jgi:hypothetical protein
VFVRWHRPLAKHSLWAALAIGSLIGASCSDDLTEPPPTTNGGSGQGGGGTMANGGNMGGQGATGGAPSTGGGGNATVLGCQEACDLINGCGRDFCAQVGVDCSMDPISLNEDVVCIVDCIAQQSDCSELTDFWANPGVTPGPDNTHVQCLSTCNAVPSPVTGVLACNRCLAGNNTDGGGAPPAGPYCLEHLTCLGQGGAGGSVADCDAWVSCVVACGEPDCYSLCNAQHPGGTPQFQPFYSCICNDIPVSETVAVLGENALCTDVCTGLMDACNQP